MKKDTCFIINYAPHYRKEIFSSIDKNMNGVFYFGNKTYGNIKKLDYSALNNFVKELTFIRLVKNFYFLLGQSFLAFKKHQNYIITGQPYNLSSWFLLVFNKVLGKRSYIWNHGWYGNESNFQKRIKKIQFSLINGYFTYGNYAKEIMIAEGLNANKIHVIYNSLDYTSQKLIRSKLNKTGVYKEHFENSYPTLFFIGRLTPIKKLDMLIKAMKQSFSKEIYYNIVVIGDGPEKETLQKLSMNLGLNKHIWYYGKCYDEDKIGELIYNANLCVSPGNIGLTAIHSLTFGCPAITHGNFASQMPEFEAIKKDVTGTFFTENNVSSLSDTLEKWLVKYPVKTATQIQACYDMIDTYYNPNLQLEILKKVVA